MCHWLPLLWLPLDKLSSTRWINDANDNGTFHHSSTTETFLRYGNFPYELDLVRYSKKRKSTATETERANDRVREKERVRVHNRLRIRRIIYIIIQSARQWVFVVSIIIVWIISYCLADERAKACESVRATIMLRIVNALFCYYYCCCFCHFFWYGPRNVTTHMKGE